MLKTWLEKRAISRRSALLGGSAAVAVAAADGAGPALARESGGHTIHHHHPGVLGSRLHSPTARPLEQLHQLEGAAAPQAAAGTLPVPPVIKVAPGHSGTLPMRAQNFQLGARKAKNLRVYDNGSAPEYLMGPTLEFGQTGAFSVRLENKLPLNPDQAQPHIVNIPSQFNTTNLHTHGLHVSPNGHGDNVYLEILPAGTDAKYADGHTSFVGRFDYLYDLKNHTPGTFWYHPHRHGSVAVQVASGAAGALIVRGGPGTIDAVPGIAGITEQVLLIQQVVLNKDGELPDFDTLWNASGPTVAADWTVNGTLGRTMSMQPGEVQRWRLVNTGFAAEAKLELQRADGSPVEMQLIAMDGVNFSPKAAKVKGVYLPPGGRADVLVQAPLNGGTLRARIGRYVALDSSAVPVSGITAGFEIGGTWQEAPFVDNKATTLFTVEVGGTPKPMPLPTATLPKPVVPDVLANNGNVGRRYVTFDVNGFPNNPKVAPPANGLPSYLPGSTPVALKFQVNGELFCPGRVMFQPRLDAVDEYYVDSPGLHVFHIHVNPFLVTEVAGEKLSTPMWRDTMLAGPKGYKALTQYTDYAGTFPIHCHILDHEDVGMMTNVTVMGPGSNSAGAPPKHGGHG